MFDFIKRKKEKKLQIISYKNFLMTNNLTNELLNQQENKLLEIYGNCKNFNNKINILVISDTNNLLDELRFADYVYRSNEYDACILIGNISTNDLNIIKKYVDKKKTYAAFEQDEFDNVDGQVIKINNVEILIVGKKILTQKESINIFDNYPSCDVLISYSNMYNGDSGLFGINYYVYKNSIPYLIHCGLLRQYKDTMKNGTKEISTFEYEYIQIN